MPQGIYKRTSPVQEKLARIKDVVLKDAASREKSMIELAKIYGVHPLSLLKFHKENDIKKKRKNIIYRGRYSYKSKIEELRDYIRENNITRKQIIAATISIFE